MGHGRRAAGAFQGYGLQPGPLLFERSPDLVWGLIATLYVGNVMLLLLNLPLAPLWVRLLLIPRPWLYGGIMVLALLGVWAVNESVADLVVLLVVGLVGYLMRVYDFPVAPALVGMILGPLAEQLRRALAIGQGDPTVLLTRPISAALLVTGGGPGGVAWASPARPGLAARLTAPSAPRGRPGAAPR